MLSEFTRKDEPDRGPSLDFTRQNGGFLRVSSKFYKDKKKHVRKLKTNDCQHVMYWRPPSVAIRSKISLTKLLRMAIALLEIPVLGWTVDLLKD